MRNPAIYFDNFLGSKGLQESITSNCKKALDMGVVRGGHHRLKRRKRLCDEEGAGNEQKNEKSFLIKNFRIKSPVIKFNSFFIRTFLSLRVVYIHRSL